MPRPLLVDVPKMEALLRQGKSWADVAREVGCSISSAKRKLHKFGQSGTKKSDICLRDERLDGLVSQVGEVNPTWGRRMIQGHLQAEMNVHVSELLIRRSIQNVQPHLVQHRVRRRLRRRRYHADHAMQVLHIDGNHKLIQWKFVFHGGIDGYSRKILFLECHEDNKSSSVYGSFKEMALVFGLPNRVRSDKGGENVLVCEAMVFLSNNVNSFMTGRSVHNQRIERFWVECNRAMSSIKGELIQLEIENSLDRSSDVDIYAVHLVYKKKIDKHLDEFVRAYNAHIISGQRASPDDLFFRSLQSTSPTSPSLEDFQRFENDAGTSFRRLVDGEHQGNGPVSVKIPEAANLCLNDTDAILADLNDYAITSKDAYLSVRSLLHAMSSLV